jgi:lycopene beta-cyclase
MSGGKPPLVIVGGGLAGSLAALALAERRPDVEFLLLEQESSFGGNHVWSFFDSDVAPEDFWLAEQLAAHSWPDHEVHFPARRRRIALGYNSVTSSSLDALVRARLRPDQYRLASATTELGPTHVVLQSGERIEAAGVLDARGGPIGNGLDLGWQKFVGRTCRFRHPHGSARPVIMDATVDQQSGYRFVYTLPFSETELMVEDTYYSTSDFLDVPLVRGLLDTYARTAGWGDAEIIGEETGVLPVLLRGELESLWPAGDGIARLGLRGGFFHPTTGYSLPDAVRNAALLAAQRDFSGPALHNLFRARAARLWKDRSFYQILNRMLFRAAEPSRRYRVLEHFYRLPDALIGRFYAGRLTALDKVRILSGKPPVPIGKALAAMRERRA